MNKEVMLVTGAGQISMAIARRVGYGKKIILGDKNFDNAKTIGEIMTNAGFDVLPFEMDLSDRSSILAMIAKGQEFGEIKMLVNGAGVSPSQAPIETILKVDLYGTAVLLEEVGKVIARGGVGVTISSQSGWRMPQLIDLKTRCIITMVALMSQGITDSSLVYHIQNAKSHGVTKQEFAAIITHVAFYAGWPKAWAVFNLAKANNIWDDAPALSEKDKYQNEIFFPVGELNPFGQYFTGQSYLAPVSNNQLTCFNVTFEPGCRNNWHIHHATEKGGQMLIGVGGKGWYQEDGKEAVEIVPGTVINIPANVKHWHGAQKDCWFTHLAFEVDGKDASTEWCEPVSDEDYCGL